MQSFTAQPLAHQTHNNPFETPYLLACLILPHLETYLAAHTSIRFLLLEYPAEHLATVLALQKLVGMDTLKVAGIIDSEPNSPSSDASSPMSSMHSFNSDARFNNSIDTNSLDSINLSGSSFPHEKTCLAHRHRGYSFSKANYLLTCSATEAEIAVFISTIWKLLIEVDPFYMPEYSPPRGRPGTFSPTTVLQRHNNTPPAYKHATAVPRPAESSPSISPQQYANEGGEEGGSTPPPRRVANPAAPVLGFEFPFAPPPPSTPPPRSGSPPPSTAGTKFRGRGGPGHTPGRRTRSRSVARYRAAEGVEDGVSLYAVSVVEEGEFYDDEERRLMPMYIRQRELRKGNSRKALKWLGLA